MAHYAWGWQVADCLPGVAVVGEAGPIERLRIPNTTARLLHSDYVRQSAKRQLRGDITWCPPDNRR